MSGSARSSQGYWDHLAEILIIFFSWLFFFKYGYVRSAVGWPRLQVWIWDFQDSSKGHLHLVSKSWIIAINCSQDIQTDRVIEELCSLKAPEIWGWSSKIPISRFNFGVLFLKQLHWTCNLRAWAKQNQKSSRIPPSPSMYFFRSFNCYYTVFKFF